MADRYPIGTTARVYFDLITAGATTFGAASSLTLNVIGGLPEDVKGNLNVTGGETTIADGADIDVNAINATGGILNVEADLTPNATPLSIDGAAVNSTALKAAAATMPRPVPCATWCRIMSCRCCLSSPWNHRPA